VRYSLGRWEWWFLLRVVDGCKTEGRVKPRANPRFANLAGVNLLEERFDSAQLDGATAVALDSSVRIVVSSP
jgi:hypothetical protein